MRESIRDNIADIIAEESIIGKDREKVIKVPIRGIREYRFVYGDNAPAVGQGDGHVRGEFLAVDLCAVRAAQIDQLERAALKR